jgi:hypothetical protein
MERWRTRHQDHGPVLWTQVVLPYRKGPPRDRRISVPITAKILAGIVDPDNWTTSQATMAARERRESMAGKRMRHTAGFNAQVALAALQGGRTVNELAAQHSVHPPLIHT